MSDDRISMTTKQLNELLDREWNKGAADMRERATRVTLDMSLSSKMAPGERHVLNIAGEKIAALPPAAGAAPEPEGAPK